MATKYLLPCECGSKVPVELRQAGQTVACGCGRSVQVPTMRQIRDLQTSDQAADAPRRPSSWGARQRVALVGLVVLLVGGCLAAYFFVRTRPRSPARILQTDLIEREVEGLRLVESLQLWARLQQEGLARQHPDFVQYHQKLADYRIRMGVTLVVVALGALTIGGSRFIPRRGIGP